MFGCCAVVLTNNSGRVLEALTSSAVTDAVLLIEGGASDSMLTMAVGGSMAMSMDLAADLEGRAKRVLILEMALALRL